MTSAPAGWGREAIGAFIDDRFLVLDVLGRGGSETLYLADDLVLDRLVALKTLHGSHDGVPSDRFLKEARALAQVQHGNVVQIYRCGRHDSVDYIAMEYVSGSDLDALIEAAASDGRRLPLRQVVDVVRGVSSALAAVHDRGLVHRDVRPRNILLEERTFRPVLIGFGLARPQGSDRAPMSFAGTPWYTAPELARDSSDVGVSVRSDIYALGCTIFELLTAGVVFEREDVPALRADHVAAPPPKLSSIRPELESFDKVIARALAKDPAHRYATCLKLLSDVEAAASACFAEPPRTAIGATSARDRFTPTACSG
jgi:serine/threonine-protein kinase